LYGNAQWSTSGGREASKEVLLNPERFCLKKVDLGKIRFANCSGTDIKEPDASFDFCWSMSSIEHFGGHKAAGKAMREMARVTRPGGIVAVATEYLLLPEYTHPEYFNQRDIQQYLIEGVPELELISRIDWNTLPPEYLIDSIVVPQGVDRLRRHVVLNDGTVQWTSIILFFRRKHSGSVRNLLRSMDTCG
jgi:SAM-dependent methyltransferase